MNRQRLHPGVFAACAAAALLVSGCAVPPWGGEQPPSSSSTGVPAGYYRVNPGDTLTRIASAYGQRPQDIAAWNQLPMGASVVPGQVLRVAPPSSFAPPPAGATLPSAPLAPVPAPTATPPAAAVSSVALAWPVRGPVLQTFAPGKSTGIVIGGTPGEQVRAAAAGRVVYAGNGIEAYGPLVIIKHNDQVVTAYGHNSRLLVKEDDAVTQGQPVAEMGTDSKGVPGVLFEIRADGKPVDPLSVLPR